MSFIKIGTDNKDDGNKDEIIPDSSPTPSAPCTEAQIDFNGKCFEISSIFEMNKEGITKEELIKYIEKLKLDENEKELEKITNHAIYLENEMEKYIDHHDYEAAKSYALDLKNIYNLMGNEVKAHEIEIKYEKIKKDYLMYKLSNPLHNPLEVFFALIFALIFAYFIDALFHIRKERKLWQLIVIFLSTIIVIWTVISVIMSMK